MVKRLTLVECIRAEAKLQMESIKDIKNDERNVHYYTTLKMNKSLTRIADRWEHGHDFDLVDGAFRRVDNE